MNPAQTDSASFFEQMVRKLEEMDIPYMVTGSMGCTVYGEPRATNDVDIVIDPPLEKLKILVEYLAEVAYVSDVAAMDAFRRRSMFNVISNETVEKIDLIFLKQTAFQQTAFERRTVQDFGTTHAECISAEDAILAKLSWSRKRQSEMQFRDVVGIAMNPGNKLDWSYLKHWARELNLTPQLQEVLNEIGSDLSLD